MRIFPTNYESRITNDEKGAALLLTFIVMITLISVVGAYLGFVQYSTRSTGAQIDDSRAIYLAEAGLDMAIWYLRNTAPDGSTDGSWRTTAYPAAPGSNPTDPQQESLGEGTFTMWVEDSGSNIKIYARGTVSNMQRIIQQEVSLTVNWASAFDYAIYGNDVSNDLEIKDNVTINGHVYYDYSNGSVEVDEDASVSNPYYIYANSVTGEGTYTQAPSAPEPVPAFPTFATTTYDAAISTAETEASGDLSLDGSDNLNLSGSTVYYEKVEIKDNATVVGSGTIVATKKVKLENNANIGEDITIITKDKIEVKDDVIVQQGGLLYAKKDISLKDEVNVTASLIAPVNNKKVKIDGDSTLTFTGLIYASKAELKGEGTINGAVVVDSFQGNKIEDDITVNYDSSYLPASTPTGLETGGNNSIESVTNTWQEI